MGSVLLLSANGAYAINCGLKVSAAQVSVADRQRQFLPQGTFSGHEIPRATDPGNLRVILRRSERLSKRL